MFISPIIKELLPVWKVKQNSIIVQRELTCNISLYQFLVDKIYEL